MHVTNGYVLREATVLGRTERELTQFAADHRRSDPAPSAGVGVLGKHRTQFVRQLVAVGGCVGPGQVDVEDQVVGLRSGQGVDGTKRCRQSLAVGRRRYEAQLLSGQFVTAGDELRTGLFDGLDVFEHADLVVLTGHHLQEGAGTGNAFGEKVDQQLRRCDQRVDAGRVVRRIGIFREVVQLAPHPVVDLLAGLADLRLVEHPKAEVPRDVADHRVPHLGGNDQPLQDFTRVTGNGRRDVLGGEPAPQQCGDHGHLVLHALQRQKQPVDRLL